MVRPILGEVDGEVYNHVCWARYHPRPTSPWPCPLPHRCDAGDPVAIKDVPVDLDHDARIIADQSGDVAVCHRPAAQLRGVGSEATSCGPQRFAHQALSCRNDIVCDWPPET